MTKHIHADNMALYAQDVMETDEPWTRWECVSCGATAWLECVVQPAWYVSYQYRRKPQTININGYEVPEPVRVKPHNGQPYYVFNVCGEPYFTTWCGNGLDNTWLQRGIIHLTKEAAELHAKALLSFTQIEEK